MTRPDVTVPEVGLVYKAAAGHQLMILTQTRITKQRNQTPFFTTLLRQQRTEANDQACSNRKLVDIIQLN